MQVALAAQGTLALELLPGFASAAYNFTVFVSIITRDLFNFILALLVFVETKELLRSGPKTMRWCETLDCFL
jgi:hypothetical protein